MNSDSGGALGFTPATADTDRRQFLNKSDAPKTNGWPIVWLSGFSAFMYFLVSYGIWNHLGYLADAFAKVARSLGLG